MWGQERMDYSDSDASRPHSAIILTPRLRFLQDKIDPINKARQSQLLMVAAMESHSILTSTSQKIGTVRFP